MNSDYLQDVLPLYYKRIFPYKPFFNWLNYGNVDNHYFEKREFSFTLTNDIYIRYKSFDDQAELEKEIKESLPCKIDIGAIYTLKPKEHKMTDQFQPTEKELVFDIDMTDYDEVRTCCTGATICNKCWRYLAVGCKILDVALREDFGWQHLLWVFSGRRGIHCWVCDESARKLSNTERTAVAEYLQLLSGGEKQTKRVILIGDAIHPSICRALKIIEDIFVPMCIEEQDLLGNQITWENFLSLIAESGLKQHINEEIKKCSTSLERWNCFVNSVDNHGKKGLLDKKCKHIIEEIMLQYAYPRLDINVTKSLNHLLKSPFCIHPKTGNVCVPFLVRSVDTFDLSTVPTIKLIEEITEYDKKSEALGVNVGNSKCKISDFKKTSLNKFVIIFQEFIRSLETTSKRNNEINGQNLDF